MGYCYVWEFIVNPDSVDTFAREYGPNGSWTRLFRKSADYERTELLHDRSNRLRFVTVDHWTSLEGHEAFMERYGDEYASLDRRLEGLTAEERLVGHFDD